MVVADSRQRGMSVKVTKLIKAMGGRAISPPRPRSTAQQAPSGVISTAAVCCAGPCLAGQVNGLIEHLVSTLKTPECCDDCRESIVTCEALIEKVKAALFSVRERGPHRKGSVQSCSRRWIAHVSPAGALSAGCLCRGHTCNSG